MREELYYQARLASYKTALYMLKNQDEAEDIAQKVCLKLCKKIDKVDNAIAWCVKVAQNEVKSLYNEKKKRLEFNTENTSLEYYDATNKAGKEKIEPEFEDITIKEAKKLLSSKDYDFYKLMLKYKLNYDKIAQQLGKSKKSVYHLSYRVKRNLVAAKLLKEGYKGTKKIVSYNFHQNLLQFIKLLKEKMLANDLKSLKQYFGSIDISAIELLDMHKIIDYEIKKNDDLTYTLMLPFYDSKKVVNFCIVTIDFDLNSRIFIKKFITNPSGIIKSNNPDNIREKLKPTRKGLLIESQQEIKKIFEQT